ncbi:MAG: nucleoside deaminase [Cytophagales bacterium]
MLSVHSPEHFMKQALNEAQKAFEKGEIPVGAVVVCNNRIIAKAHNQTELLNDVTAHAEILAITTASTALGGKYLRDCTIYITLEPCIMCAGALAWSQVSNIVYGANDELKGFSKFLNSNIFSSKTLIRKGVMEEESSIMLKEFFKKLRKK